MNNFKDILRELFCSHEFDWRYSDEYKGAIEECPKCSKIKNKIIWNLKK
jgi:hypothetical protein